MIIVNVYSIYDSKVEAYLQPFFSVNDSVAKRAFIASAATDNTFRLNAADYTLFRIGTFDSKSGRIDGLSVYENLGNGLTLQVGATISDIRDAFKVEE